MRSGKKRVGTEKYDQAKTRSEKFQIQYFSVSATGEKRQDWWSFEPTNIDRRDAVYCYWGEWSERHDSGVGSPIVKTLGLKGRVCWPLSLAAHVFSENGATHKDIVKRIIARAAEIDSDFRTRLAQPSGGRKDSKTLQDKVEGLFKNAECSYPPLDMKTTIERATKQVFLNETGLDESVLSSIERHAHKAPLDAFEAACFAILRARARDIKSYIGPQLSIQENEYDFATRERRLLESKLNSGLTRLTVLHGQSLGGKTKILGELIQSICVDGPDRSKRFYVKHSDQELSLPVFAMTVKGLPYESIVNAVTRFLVLEGTISDTAVRQEDTLDAFDLDEKLRRVAEAARTPALYILNCANLLPSGAVRDNLVEPGLLDLLRTLLSGNPQTRVVVATSNDVPPDSVFTAVGCPHPEKVPAPAPTFEFALELLGSARLKAEFRALFRRSLYETANAPATIGFGAACNLLDAVPERLVEVYSGISGVRPDDDPGGKLDEFFIECWRTLKLALSERALPDDSRLTIFDALCMLATSEDGLLPESLGRMLSELNAPVGKAPVLMVTTVSCLRILAGFSASCKNAFVRGFPIPRLLPHAMFWDESRRAMNGNALASFEMDSPLRLALEQAFKQDDPAQFRKSKRLVARLARQRARNTKLGSNWTYGSKSSDFRRDLQAINALLASVEAPTTSATRGLTGPAFGGLQDIAFDRDNLENWDHVIRFVLGFILRKELDLQHRLTQSLDEDDLRLRLYLSVIFGMGTGVVTDIDDLPLPGQLPAFLPQALCLSEAAALLQAIGIASYHCGRFNILDWAEQQLRQLREEPAAFRPSMKRGSETPAKAMRDEPSTALVRLIALRIDADFQSGDFMDGPTRSEYVRSQVPRRLASAKRIMPVDKWSQAKCELRLKHRELSLVDWEGNSRQRAGEDGNSGALANRVELLNTKRADLVREIVDLHLELVSRSDDMTAGYGGRAGHMLVSSIAGNPAFQPFFLDQPGKQVSWIAEERFGYSKDASGTQLGLSPRYLLDVLENVSALLCARLSGYSGAERANAQCSHALIAYVRGDIEEAIHFARSSTRQVVFTRASYPVRMECHWILAQLLAVRAYNMIGDRSNSAMERVEIDLLAAFRTTKAIISNAQEVRKCHDLHFFGNRLLEFIYILMHEHASLGWTPPRSSGLSKEKLKLRVSSFPSMSEIESGRGVITVAARSAARFVRNHRRTAMREG